MAEWRKAFEEGAGLAAVCIALMKPPIKKKEQTCYIEPVRYACQLEFQRTFSILSSLSFPGLFTAESPFSAKDWEKPWERDCTFRLLNLCL